MHLAGFERLLHKQGIAQKVLFHHTMKGRNPAAEGSNVVKGLGYLSSLGRLGSFHELVSNNG